MRGLYRLTADTIEVNYGKTQKGCNIPTSRPLSKAKKMQFAAHTNLKGAKECCNLHVDANLKDQKEKFNDADQLSFTHCKDFYTVYKFCEECLLVIDF